MIAVMLMTLLSAGEPVPPEVTDAVRILDSSLPGGDVAEWVGRLLDTRPEGQASTVRESLKGKADAVLCFFLLNMLDALNLGGGGLGSTVREDLRRRLTQMHWDRCQGPGGNAADTQHTRLGNALVRALSAERVATAAERDLVRLRAGQLSPQLMHSLPAGPPPPGVTPAHLALTGAVIAVVFGLMVPPSEAAAWPLLLIAVGG